MHLGRRPECNRKSIAELATELVQKPAGDAVHQRIRQHEGEDDARIFLRRDVKLF